MLTEWRVTKQGSQVDGHASSATTIDSLDLAFNRPIRVRFEVKKDAEYPNGLNLYGSGFGDHPQDIILSFVRYTEA